MRKNIILLFLVVFSIGIIVTYPAFANSHTLDGYCTIYNGYLETALLFFQNGRIFSGLFFTFFDFLDLPVDSLSFVSSFLMNLFLALGITKLYFIFKENLKIESTIKKIILLICVFLLLYSPLFTEIILLDESFVIALGILFTVLAAERINKGGIFNYISSILLMIMAISCYQGIVALLIPIVVLMSSKINSKEELKMSLTKIGVSVFSYLISFLANYGIIKIVFNVTGSGTSKIGNLNLLTNIDIIFNDLLPNSLKTLYGFVNIKFYYLLVIVLLAIALYLIGKNKNKKINLSLLIILVGACILLPFVPNLVMNSDSNYSAARMCLTLGIFPSVLLIYIISLFEVNFKINCVCLVAIGLMFILTAYSIHQNTMINFKRYKEDVKYIKSITERIKWYENESGNKVKQIYYAKDTSVNYYYSFGNANGANIRLLAIDWAMDCAFPVYSDRKYEFSKMTGKDYDKYFKNKNYDEFDKEQLKFVDDKLYLLLY